MVLEDEFLKAIKHSRSCATKYQLPVVITPPRSRAKAVMMKRPALTGRQKKDFLQWMNVMVLPEQNRKEKRATARWTINEGQTNSKL
jgi:hypothetical protein